MRDVKEGNEGERGEGEGEREIERERRGRGEMVECPGERGEG